MATLPSRAELAQRLQRFERDFKRALGIMTAVGFVAVILMIGAASMGTNQQYPWIAWAAFAVALLIILSCAFFIDHRRSKLARDNGVICAACRKPLLQLNAKLALTTGRCAECGALVISDP